jgi:hypothetical protein
VNAKTIISLIVLFALGCNGDRENKFQVELHEDLEKIINGYVLENGVDINRKIITTEWNVVVPDRTDIYISNSNTDLFLVKGNSPTYYAELKTGVIVFIYTNIERLVERDVRLLNTEIKEILRKNEITLNPFTRRTYSAPTWLITSCPGRTTEVTKVICPLEYSFVPCGYSIRKDSVRRDSLYIHRLE